MALIGKVSDRVKNDHWPGIEFGAGDDVKLPEQVWDEVRTDDDGRSDDDGVGEDGASLVEAPVSSLREVFGEFREIRSEGDDQQEIVVYPETDVVPGET